MSDSLIHPIYYLIVRREGRTWHFSMGTPFYNPLNLPVAATMEDRLYCYHLTPAKVIIELFRINGGKPGYYLANLRKKSYYFCGENHSDIRQTLQQLGIGRPDPMG
ncbi:hypothetical protein IQ268_09105 [Oculatella sp. LEGE 06141]|uniref:hypothetical protein n=1 Tax=Oculatella sp. LEGE 06141 TaxID=1828648 RepID=UPI0018801BF4|nr:hypothetical protein [Oculatella sp. LEGE 06141]MBE9178717.1 hypothetical protein [Oculatella sp. LEGE 06141]